MIAQVFAARQEVTVAVIAALSLLAATSITVGASIWQAHATRQRIGQPNGGGSIAGDIASLKSQVAVAATAAGAALAVSEATAVEVRNSSTRLERHLAVHGYVPLDDAPGGVPHIPTSEPPIGG